MSNNNFRGAGDAYRAHLSTQPDSIIEVIAPSGFTFKFRKPSKFATVFAMSGLPQHLTSEAVAAWGSVQDGGTPEVSTELLKEMVPMMQSLADQICTLSHSPKIVKGAAAGPDEISTNEIPDDDLNFLFAWAMSGGEQAELLGRFLKKQGASDTPSPNRKERRTKAKLAA